MLRVLKVIGLTVAGLLGSLVAVWLFIAIFNIHINLEGLRGPVGSLLGSTLDRRVELTGTIRLAPTLWPTLEVTGVHVGDPAPYESTDFAVLDRLYLQLGILPLLFGDILVREAAAGGVRVRLVRYVDGTETWKFGTGTQGGVAEVRDREPDGVPGAPAGAIELKTVELLDIGVLFADSINGEFYDLRMDELVASAVRGKPMRMRVTGSVVEQPYTIDFTGGPIDELFDPTTIWPANFTLDVAATRLSVESRDANNTGDDAARNIVLYALSRGIDFKFSVAAETLSSLSALTQIDLPPLGPYEVSGALTATTSAVELSSLDVRVGDSDLSGSGRLELGGERPFVRADLETEVLQLDDFDHFLRWSPLGSEGEPADPEISLATGAGDSATTPPDEGVDGGEPQGPPVLAPVVAQEVLSLADGRVDIRVGQVLSSDDELGAGRLVAGLDAGVLSVDTLRVEIPEGSVDIALTFEPRVERVRSTISMGIERLDYGVALRRFQPEAEARGWLFLDVSLASEATQYRDLLEHATGHLKFAVWPDSLDAGILDLWAVNVFTAVLLRFDEESVINCAVGNFELEDGITEDGVVLIDSSRMRVLGEAAVDFQSETIDATFEPITKKPQFISLATPIQVRGTFDEFGLGVKGVDIASTVITNVMTVVTLGIPLLFYEKLPEDGTEACLATLYTSLEEVE